MSGFKSYNKTQIKTALANGEQVWALDTGTDGDDDHLIGTREEVIAAICEYHEIAALKAHWSLNLVDWDIG